MRNFDKNYVLCHFILKKDPILKICAIRFDSWVKSYNYFYFFKYLINDKILFTSNFHSFLIYNEMASSDILGKILLKLAMKSSRNGAF